MYKIILTFSHLDHRSIILLLYAGKCNFANSAKQLNGIILVTLRVVKRHRVMAVPHYLINMVPSIYYYVPSHNKRSV